MVETKRCSKVVAYAFVDRNGNYDADDKFNNLSRATFVNYIPRQYKFKVQGNVNKTSQLESRRNS